MKSLMVQSFARNQARARATFRAQSNVRAFNPHPYTQAAP